MVSTADRCSSSCTTASATATAMSAGSPSSAFRRVDSGGARACARVCVCAHAFVFKTADRLRKHNPHDLCRYRAARIHAHTRARAHNNNDSDNYPDPPRPTRLGVLLLTASRHHFALLVLAQRVFATALSGIVRTQCLDREGADRVHVCRDCSRLSSRVDLGGSLPTQPPMRDRDAGARHTGREVLIRHPCVLGGSRIQRPSSAHENGGPPSSLSPQ